MAKETLGKLTADAFGMIELPMLPADILDRFRAERLFWSHNHPTSLLLKRLALDLLDRVDLRDFMDVEASHAQVE